MIRFVLVGGLALGGLFLAGPAWAQLPNSFIRNGRNDPSQDWNKNGIPDYLERQGYRDWNKNGIPDYLETVPKISQRDMSMIPSRYNQQGGYYLSPYGVMPLGGGWPVSRHNEAVRPHR